MSPTTHRYDESFTIPADATRERVLSLFTDAVFAIGEDGADIDWANLEVSSERNQEQFINRDVWTNTFHESTTVFLTARGRK